jgi:hypothetical protein
MIIKITILVVVLVIIVSAILYLKYNTTNPSSGIILPKTTSQTTSQTTGTTTSPPTSPSTGTTTGTTTLPKTTSQTTGQTTSQTTGTTTGTTTLPKTIGTSTGTTTLPKTTGTTTSPSTGTTEKKDSLGVKIIKDIATPETATGIGLTVIRDVVANQIDKKVFGYVDGTFSKIVKAQFEKIGKSMLTKLEQKGGATVLQKLGMKGAEKAAKEAAEKIAEKAAIKAGEKVATKGGIIGSKVAASTQLAATTGPAFPFVEAGLLAFDVLSLALDLGDAAGYGKMGTNAQYIKIRDGINKAQADAYKQYGISPPIVTSPLDKLTMDDYTSLIKSNVDALMSSTNTNQEVKEMFDKMAKAVQNDIISGKLKESDINDTDKMAPYQAMINTDRITEIATVNVCIAKGGKIINIAEPGKPTNNVCTYSSKEACDSSYKWPDVAKDGSKDTYSEYKTDKYGGYCSATSYGMRGICESAHIPYDLYTGSCKVDENYCKSKGAEWGFNKSINMNDCYIPKGQDIAETLFGTTVVRGLKQIFDPDQYETCKSNEYDFPYTCAKCPEGKVLDATGTIALSAVISFAASSTGAGSLCYKECKKGYESAGAICQPLGGPGIRKTLFDRQYCDPDQELEGGLCRPRCPEGYKKIGLNICQPPSGPPKIVKTVFDRYYCDPGDKNVAGVCWKPCPDSHRIDDGALCRDPIGWNSKCVYWGFGNYSGCATGGSVVPKKSYVAKKRPCTYWQEIELKNLGITDKLDYENSRLDDPTKDLLYISKNNELNVLKDKLVYVKLVVSGKQADITKKIKEMEALLIVTKNNLSAAQLFKSPTATKISNDIKNLNDNLTLLKNLKQTQADVDNLTNVINIKQKELESMKETIKTEAKNKIKDLELEKKKITDTYNWRDDGTSCWTQDIGRGFGTMPHKYPCSKWDTADIKLRDDGTSCWADSYGRGLATEPSIRAKKRAVSYSTNKN